METIAEYTKIMGIRISEEQYQKFQKSGYDKFSDFARDVIDSYNEGDITLQLKVIGSRTGGLLWKMILL